MYSLFLNVNCAIRPCCQGETNETIMIQKIIKKIRDLIEYTQVTDNYILHLKMLKLI